MSPPLFILAAVGLFLSTNAFDARATGSSPRCSPSGSVTVAESSEARVYRKRKSSTLHFACWKRTGKTKLLDKPSSGITYFGRPAISLAGSVLVSGAIEVPEAIDTESDTFVFVEDLRASLAGGPGVPSNGFSFSLFGVGGIAAKPNGSFAYIECPSSGVDSPCSEGRQEPFKVYRVTASRQPKPKRLDRSRGIEPSSLTVSGSRLRWTKYGKRYSASLP